MRPVGINRGRRPHFSLLFLPTASIEGERAKKEPYFLSPLFVLLSPFRTFFARLSYLLAGVPQRIINY